MCLIVVRLLMVLQPRGEARDLVPVAEDVPVAVVEAVALQGHILPLQQRLVNLQLQRKLGRGSRGDFDVSPTVVLRSRGQISQPPLLEVTQAVGGRLIFYAKIWPMINPDSWVLRTVTEGYLIEFTETLPSHAVVRKTILP